MTLQNAPQQENKLTPYETTRKMLERITPQIGRALPKHMTAERMVRIALTELRRTPKLLECTPESFCAGIIMCSQLGLEPGTALGQIYLIPYKNNSKLDPVTKKPIMEATVQIGYKGMIELARRSGQIVSLSAHEVYEKDKFEFEYGLEEKLKHVPNLNERGKLIAVYSIAHFMGGGHQIEVMSKADVDKIRALSKMSNSAPWQNFYSEMAKKTVLRKLFKYLPISIEKLQVASSIDEQADHGEQNLISFVREEDEDIDLSTGEVFESEVVPQADALADKIK